MDDGSETSERLFAADAERRREQAAQYESDARFVADMVEACRLHEAERQAADAERDQVARDEQLAKQLADAADANAAAMGLLEQHLKLLADSRGQAQVMLAEVHKNNQLIIAHGNGPQVGLLALMEAAYTAVDPYPLDVLGAETVGMIGYVIEQELGNIIPIDDHIVTVLTQVLVDPSDPAFEKPTKPVGPTRLNAHCVTSPGPQATSRTRMPDFSPAS